MQVLGVEGWKTQTIQIDNIIQNFLATTLTQVDNPISKQKEGCERSNGENKEQSNLWHMYGIFSRGTVAIQNYYLQSKTGYIQKSRIMCLGEGHSPVLVRSTSLPAVQGVDRGPCVPHGATVCQQIVVINAEETDWT